MIKYGCLQGDDSEYVLNLITAIAHRNQPKKYAGGFDMRQSHSNRAFSNKKPWLVTLMAVVMGSAMLISGCAATTTSVRYAELDVQTKMSSTIFLEPVAPQKRTVFVQIRNTSDKLLNIEEAIRGAILARGYTIESDPTKAHYILQANVLQVGKVDVSALEQNEGAAFGGLIVGTAAGALLGGSHAGEGAIIGGLLAGLVENISGSLVKVVHYSMITDLQISERVKAPVSEEFKSKLKQGSSSSSSQQSATTSNLKRYQTRIVSTARKVDLEFAEALPHLEQGLVNSISGTF